MKVVFLDCDGVLNTEQFQIERVKKFGRINHMDLYFQPSCMRHLKRIIDKTDCKIVISSTWRLFEQRIGAIETNFVIHNIDPSVIIGKTPNFTYTNLFSDGSEYVCRGSEIKAWIKNNDKVNFNIDKIVIIDDDSDMSDLKDHLIQTSWKNGLTRKLANKAIRMLNE